MQAPAETPTKTCTVCKVAKPSAQFHRWSRSKDGLNSRCKPCASAENKAYRSKNRDLVLAGKKAAYRLDPERNRARNEVWKARNPERHKYLVRRSWLKQNYNMTHEDYEARLAAQNYSCGLCGKPAGEKRLHVDHDHACCPGKRSCGSCVRGLLCGACNGRLGWLETKRELIAAYLGKEN